jgi:hypothetical protein
MKIQLLGVASIRLSVIVRAVRLIASRRRWSAWSCISNGGSAKDAFIIIKLRLPDLACISERMVSQPVGRYKGRGLDMV